MVCLLDSNAPYKIGDRTLIEVDNLDAEGLILHDGSQV
jgi:hypothetical protein